MSLSGNRLMSGRLGARHLSRLGRPSGRRPSYTDLIPLIDSFTRASKAWAWDSAGNLQEYASGEIRKGVYTADGTFGNLLVEEVRTNLFLNSDSPATQTITISSTGDYTVSVHGSGSATSSANTATGTGFGEATEGSDNTFNISATGTVDITISGTPDYAQVEAGPFSTTPIITAGAAVTRAADVPVITDVSSISQSAGTFYIKALVQENTTASQTLFSYDDSTSDNRLQLSIDRTFMASGGTTQANYGGASPSAGSVDKHAVSYQANDVRSAINGAQYGSDATNAMPVGVTRIAMGLDRNNSFPTNGYIIDARWYPSSRTQTQIETLTT